MNTTLNEIALTETGWRAARTTLLTLKADLAGETDLRLPGSWWAIQPTGWSECDEFVRDPAYFADATDDSPVTVVAHEPCTDSVMCDAHAEVARESGGR